MNAAPNGQANDRTFQRRRKAVEAFMARHDLKAAEWARAAGLSTANSLYNFISGRSRTLSQETLEKLAKAVPGATVTEIIGETPATGLKADTVQIRVAAGAGMWRNSYEASMDPALHMALPPKLQADEAAVILDDHVNELYPRGAYVGVQAFAALNRALRSGDLVLVHRVRGGKHEVTVREVQLTENETASLIFRTSDAKYRTQVQMPWPYRGEVFEADGDSLQVRGRVVIMVLVQDEDF